MTTRARSGWFWQVQGIEEIKLLRGGFAQAVEAALSGVGGVFLDARQQRERDARTGAFALGLQPHAHDAIEDECQEADHRVGADAIIWFERIDNSLIVRIHGADDTFTFENWFHGQGTSAHLQGFAAGGEWLGHEQVNDLVAVMSDQIANLNDGTTAYGILPGQTPDEILAAIDAAWV